jgi:hypothetical protein
MIQKIIELLQLLDTATLNCVVRFLKGVASIFGKKE